MRQGYAIFECFNRIEHCSCGQCPPEEPRNLERRATQEIYPSLDAATEAIAKICSKPGNDRDWRFDGFGIRKAIEDDEGDLYVLNGEWEPRYISRTDWQAMRAGAEKPTQP